MFEKFVERAADHLADFRKELASVEKVVDTLKNTGQLNIFEDEDDLLANLQPVQKTNLLTKLRRLCENLARLSTHQTIPVLHFSKNGLETAPGAAAESDLSTCFKEQANFWTIFRSIVDTMVRLETDAVPEPTPATRAPIQPAAGRPNQDEIRLQKIIGQFNVIYADKVKVWNEQTDDCFSNLKKVNKNFFEQVFTSSIELIHYIINEDSNLSYVHQYLRGFQNVEDQEILIRRKEEDLQHKVTTAKLDLLNSFTQSDPAICEDFVDLVILKLRSSNTTQNAILFLERYGFKDLASIIRGLTPYHDNSLLEKLWAKDASSYKGLDVFSYLDKKTFQAGGNDNWLDMIRQLQQFSADNTNPRHLRKLMSYLSFDYVKYDEFLEQPLDKLHNILRVAYADQCYLNTEVLKRYICFRKLISKHQLILFDEDPSYEELFASLPCIDVLRRQR